MSRPLFSVGSNGPSLLKVVEYGILGGLAGMPVSVVFRDFPYDLLGQLSAAVRRALPKDQVAEVWTQADVQRFRKDLNTLRAVLVYSGNGKAVSANVFDWLIQHRRGGYQPLPAVISAYSRNSSESQGTSLVIQADPSSCAKLQQFLDDLAVQELTEANEPGPMNGQQIDTLSLRRAIRAVGDGESLVSVRDTEIVVGLASGAAIVQSGSSSRCSGERITLGPEHYTEVYGLLNDKLFHVVDQPFDALTIQMVARANAYLKMRSGSSTPTPSPLGGRSGTTSTSPANNPEIDTFSPITRRELVDLGTPTSAVATSLVESLLRNSDFDSLERIGVNGVERGRQPSATRPPEVSEAVRSLTPWTYKMVRSRFDRLQSEGLIEASRTTGNAALSYVLPENLNKDRSRYSHLPKPEDVAMHFT